MKTIQRKKAKIKILKVGIKQTKAKLPQYKRKHRLVQGKRKSFLKCLNMNSSFTESANVQDNSSANLSNNEQLVLQCNLKQKKKSVYTTGKKSNNKTRYSMDLSLGSREDSTEARLAKDRDDKQYRDVSKEQRNLGSPVIIEALSENLSSLSIPEVLRHNRNKKTKNNTSVHKLLHTQDVSSEKDDVCVIVAESVNPNDTFHSRDHNTIASLSRGNHKEQKDKKLLQKANSNSSTNTWDSREPSPTYEECLENIKLDTADRDSNVLEAEAASSPYRKSKNNIQDDQNLVRFYCLRNKVVVIMSKNTRFCFTGKLVMKIMYGAVEAYGCVMTTESESMEIYSPRGYSSVLIETSDKFTSKNDSNIWTSLQAEGIYKNTENKLVADINQLQAGSAVILLSNLENKLTKFLNIFYPFKLFPRIRNASYVSWTDLKRAEAILHSNLYVDNYGCKELIIDKRVTQEVKEKMVNRWRANEWSCTLIAGGKNVGKSTTTRYLINSLLPITKMVVLVDVDPGQAECTPPGCISFSVIEQPLMGPNFTHLKMPVYQLYIGDVNVTRCITRYIEGIKLLVDKLINSPVLSRLPIVVNTMGFTQGIGWDIVIFTIKLIRPSLVVEIMSAKSKNNYSAHLSKEIVNQQTLSWAPWSKNVVDWRRQCDHELCVLRSHAERKSAPVNDTWNMEPYQQRELVMISYLSDIVQSSASSASYYDSDSLNINQAVPYATSFSSLTISISRASVPPSHVLNVVNGNIVALCGIDIEDNESQDIEVTSGLRVLNRSPLCSCYGFGIVRGVDTEREEVFINTPLSASMMQYVNCLIGCIPVPVTLLQPNQQKNIPYTGGNNVLPTSREPRRGYFRMRYQRVQRNV